MAESLLNLMETVSPQILEVQWIAASTKKMKKITSGYIRINLKPVIKILKERTGHYKFRGTKNDNRLYTKSNARQKTVEQHNLSNERTVVKERLFYRCKSWKNSLPLYPHYKKCYRKPSGRRKIILYGNKEHEKW